MFERFSGVFVAEVKERRLFIPCIVEEFVGGGRGYAESVVKVGIHANEEAM